MVSLQSTLILTVSEESMETGEVQTNRGTESPSGPAHNGAARLAGDLSAREGSSTIASDPHANSKVEFDSAGKYLLRRAPRRPVIATRSSGLP